MTPQPPPSAVPTLQDQLAALGTSWLHGDYQQALRRFSRLLGDGARGDGLASAVLASLSRTPLASGNLDGWLRQHSDAELLDQPLVRAVLERADGHLAHWRASLLQVHPDGRDARAQALSNLGPGNHSPARVDQEALLLLRDQAGRSDDSQQGRHR